MDNRKLNNQVCRAPLERMVKTADYIASMEKLTYCALVLLLLTAVSACKSAPAPPIEEEVLILPVPVEDAVEVRELVFAITSIAILRGDLVNTRFKVGLRIGNPNPFPVDLSALHYRLYGNGRRWADGADRDIINVAGNSTFQGDFFLTMNFIDMDRSLLDQIIRLEDVHYRFTGNAMLDTGLDSISPFSTSFDISGYSVVLDE